jgi:hypothetical protein
MIDTSKNAEQNAEASKTGSVKWWKIIPDVKLRTYCTQNAKWYLDVTYYVVPYTVYNRTHPNVPKDMPKGWHREYNYIYTGQNNDIIDFDINFNTLYYTAQTTYRGAVTSLYKNQTESVRSTEYQNSDSYQGSEQKRNSVMPIAVKPQVYNAKSRATGGTIDAKSVAVADLEDSLMTLSAADMLNVQLKIVGDPQFLKQDDCFYNPNTVNLIPGADPRLTQNGSLLTDYGEIYIQLYFRTPKDINESDGLYDFGSNYRTSVFSGIYKVLTVQSNFKSGVFIQTIDLIRLPYQPNYDYVGQRQQITTERNKDINMQTTSAENINNNIISVPVPDVNRVAEATDLRSAQQQLSRTLSDIPTLNTEQLNLKKVIVQAQALPINRNNEPVIVPTIRPRI